MINKRVYYDEFYDDIILLFEVCFEDTQMGFFESESGRMFTLTVDYCSRNLIDLGWL
jgi:hypothetical protein